MPKGESLSISSSSFPLFIFGGTSTLFLNGNSNSFYSLSFTEQENPLFKAATDYSGTILISSTSFASITFSSENASSFFSSSLSLKSPKTILLFPGRRTKEMGVKKAKSMEESQLLARKKGKPQKLSLKQKIFCLRSQQQREDTAQRIITVGSARGMGNALIHLRLQMIKNGKLSALLTQQGMKELVKEQ